MQKTVLGSICCCFHIQADMVKTAVCESMAFISGKALTMFHIICRLRIQAAALGLIFILFIGCSCLEKPVAVSSMAMPSGSAGPLFPERVVLNLTEHPESAMAVTWRVAGETKHPMAQILPASAFPEIEEHSRTETAVCEKINPGEDNGAFFYSAVFSGLHPGTTYMYRVGSEGNWSEWNRFSTASDDRAPFSFIFFGDVQDHIQSMCSWVFRAAYRKAPNADFWFFAGDLVDDGERDEEWAQLFDAMGWVPRTTPLLLLPGNHEYPDRRYVSRENYRITKLWGAHFTQPVNGPEGLEEKAYAIDYKFTKLVMLDGNQKLEEQARWLEKILSENRQPWVILGIHQPAVSTFARRSRNMAGYGAKSSVSELLVPLFDKYSVDLVLQGHHHFYARTDRIKNGQRAGKDETGTVYVVSVSGPKQYDHGNQNRELMAKMGEDKQLYQVITVDPHRLSFKAYDVSGEVFDSFMLEK